MIQQRLARKRISRRLVIDALVIVTGLVVIGIAIGFGIDVAPLASHLAALYAG